MSSYIGQITQIILAPSKIDGFLVEKKFHFIYSGRLRATVFDGGKIASEWEQFATAPLSIRFAFIVIGSYWVRVVAQVHRRKKNSYCRGMDEIDDNFWCIVTFQLSNHIGNDVTWHIHRFRLAGAIVIIVFHIFTEFQYFQLVRCEYLNGNGNEKNEFNARHLVSEM